MKHRIRLGFFHHIGVVISNCLNCVITMAFMTGAFPSLPELSPVPLQSITDVPSHPGFAFSEIHKWNHTAGGLCLAFFY